MRKLLCCIFFLISATLFANDTKSLDSLLDRRHFFELRRQLQSETYITLPAWRKLYYEAFVNNFFHDLPASNASITLLLEKHKKQLSGRQIGSLLLKKIDNHVKLYQYRDAHQTAQLLLRKYRNSLNPAEQEDARNSDVIWKGLQHIPPQTTSITSETGIPYRRDLAGLINIPVTVADSTFYFVFDTGANLSVITESYARKSKLQRLNVKFKVRAITGLQVNANLGIAKELRMGNIVVKNAVFMVFPDSSLSFARGQYTINGIIGFPIIEQLQEIRINNSNVTIPAAPVDRKLRNFGVDELLPVISVAYKTDTLAFTFDTGAQFTFLNDLFYRRYRKLVDSAGKMYEMQIGGAGGVTRTKAFKVPQIGIQVAAQNALLKDVAVKTSSSTPKDKLYYGNLGQDIMNQFKEMIINFRYMYVDFIR